MTKKVVKSIDKETCHMLYIDRAQMTRIVVK